MPSTLSPDDEQVLMRGLAVQPFLTAFLGVLLFLPSEVAIVMGVFFGIAGTAITVCVAYPLVLWCIRRRKLTLTRTLVSGAMLGNIPAAIAAALTIGSAGRAAELGTLVRPAAMGTVVGVTAATAFWILSGRHLSRRRRAPS